MTTIEELEQRLRAAIGAAQRQGYRIRPGRWGVQWERERQAWTCPDGACCPLGALLLAEQPARPPETEGLARCGPAVAALLGITTLEAVVLASGVDGGQPGGLTPSEQAYYALGRRLLGGEAEGPLSAEPAEAGS